MSKKNLLVELFVEELPPKALKSLGQSFAHTLSDQLRAQGLSTDGSVVTYYASPRRLAAHITAVADAAADKAIQQKLMPVSVALTSEGQPTTALLKKLHSLGLDETAVSTLKRAADGKNEALFLDIQVTGISLRDGLQKALEESLTKLPIPKVMSYQLADGWSSVNFVRPAHGLVALHGNDIVNVAVLGLNAGRVTHGHRFEATQTDIHLIDADSYESQLANEGAVIASFSARRDEIVKQLQASANAEGLTPITDEDLLDEVTALVERPNVLTCEFEKEFLDVPAECLILTMKANQKYFPLLDASGKLTHKFLVVSNIRPTNPARVIEGNERVVRPRLADAKFFFDEDRKHTLVSRLSKLSKVVYHNQLGSQLDRVERVRSLASLIGEQLNADTAGKANQAAQIAKADLLTGMVGEFPELQGIMGRYYALADGLDTEIAEAVREQYLPRGAGDDLPTTPTGIALALADKVETLCGIFAVGQKPTGTKDPFGLRRAAIGVLRILIERHLPINLSSLIEHALRQQPIQVKPETETAVYDYIMERLRSYYLESNTELIITTEMFDAVLTNRPTSPLDFDTRLRALANFLKHPDAAALAAANKRIHNILKKSAIISGTEVQPQRFVEAAERNLFDALQHVETQTAPLFGANNYEAALTHLAALRLSVDQFFDSVMVMAEDVSVRDNRLALLSRMRTVFLKVADLSCLPG